MPRARISVDGVEPDPKVKTPEPQVVFSVENKPDSPPEIVNEVVPVEPKGEVKKEFRLPDELTTDEELRKISGKTSMSTFVAFPQNIHFAGTTENEEIALVLRAHLITNVPWILVSVLAALVPVVVVPLLEIGGFISSVPSGIMLFVLVLWYMAAFSYSFLQVLSWYFNVGIVTNERVIDVDWINLTSHDTTNTQISKIEDVKSVRNGVMQGVFDYGDVTAQTSGTQQNVEFLNVPHPELVVRKIQELMQNEDNQREISQ